MMKLSRTKIVAYLGMIALLASMIMGLLGYSNSNKHIVEIKNKLLYRQIENNINLTIKYLINSYGNLTQGDGTLLDSEGQSIEGRYGMVDSILEDLGDESTIFVKENNDFRRISTNIRSNNNERVIGTYLGKDHAAYNTVMQGEVYIGEAEILGEGYYTAYQPIKDKNNNVIGLLFVGTPTEELDNLIEVQDDRMNAIDTAIIIFRGISLGSLIILVGSSASENRLRKEQDPL
ncbi:MAG: Cache 3/Cache 2 fusion domain-containing protein [Tissierellia bacterium]|nr:Cache 3/Cache 2 fusion domain-containing protein [Tissierellia bacterium]